MAEAAGAGQSSGGCFRRNKIKRSQVEDEVDTYIERELAQRPDVGIMNRYAVTMAYIFMGMKGLGSLALLWASVVLLGGFVTMLNKKDFWYLTIMSFVQAAGAFYSKWTFSQIRSKGKHSHVVTHSPLTSKEEYFGMKKLIYNIGSATIYFITLVIFYPVLILSVYGPWLCIILSIRRLRNMDYYGRADGAANLNPALNIFYSLSLAQGAIFILWGFIQVYIGQNVVAFVSRLHGFNSEVVENYFHDIQLECMKDPACTSKWNLITYGAGLLDSVLPDDFLRGARVLNMLIEQGIPIRRLLIGALGWRISVSANRETTGLAARIVAHLAGDLNLARFPVALEFVSTLLEPTCHKNGDQEAQEQAGSRSTCNISAARTQDIENPPPRGSDQHGRATPRSDKQQSEERRLQAALLSLCAAIRTRCINAGDFASVLEKLITREDFVGKLKDIVEENRYTTPACLAIQKLTCEMVTLLIPHDQRVEEIEGKKEIIDALSQASETMAGLESCLLFAGTDRDCHGVPVKPLFPVLVKQARELLRQKLQELGMDTSAGGLYPV